MSGHIDLGHDGNVALGGVRHDAAHLLLRVEAAVEPRPAGGGIEVALRRPARRHAPGADTRESRVAPDLEPPALIIGHMPAEHVELVQRHPVEVAQDEADRLKVARRVEHQAAPAEARRVAHEHRRKGEHSVVQARRAALLPERHGTVEEAARSARRHHYPLGRHLEAVTLRRRARRCRIELEGDRARRDPRRAALAHRECDPVARAQVRGEIGGDARRLRAMGNQDQRAAPKHEDPRTRNDFGGSRNDVRQHVRRRPAGTGEHCRGPHRQRKPRSHHFPVFRRCASCARSRSLSAGVSFPSSPCRCGGMWPVTSAGSPNT